MVGSRLRFAAGVCILAAGLLAGGGAVAVADPGLGGSSSNGDDGTNDPVPSAGSPVGNVTDTVRETIQGVTGTPGSGAQPGQQPSTGATSTLGSGRQPGQQPSTGATSPKTAAGGTDTEDQKEDAGLVTADPNPLAAVPNVVLPVTDVVAPVTDVVTPVTDVVAPVTSVLAPVSDVIAAGQDMLTLVAGAVVPLTQLPSDLSSFMLGIAGVAPAGDASGGIDGAALSTAAGASLASQLPLGPPLPGISGVPVAGNATRVATLDVISLGRASALSGMAPQASNGASPMGAESFFRHVLDELLLVASIWALATAALPGLGGLVILIAAGVRVGYRQAKAGFALRTPGTARFVRSESLVVVRPGALRVERPGALSAGCLLDKVA